MKACMREINIPINETQARKVPQKLLFMFPDVPAFTGRSEVKAVFTQPHCSGSHVVYLKATASQTYKKKKLINALHLQAEDLSSIYMSICSFLRIWAWAETFSLSMPINSISEHWQYTQFICSSWTLSLHTLSLHLYNNYLYSCPTVYCPF